MKNIKDMSDQEIKGRYYSLINQSRQTFYEQQKIERFLESPLLMCCFMVLWLWMAFIFLFFIWIAPREGFQLFLIGGIPLAILLFTTRHYKKEWSQKKRKVNQIHYQLDAFRTKLEKAKRDIPPYPFTEASSYPLDYKATYPFDEYTYYEFEE
ncbi:hypothetical protein [Halalkalibacter alkaliphilus]|uniref:Uncharacterized protein n=1 Tax=Halalkalibacter alkaliphilus TaxID=2917993 RepID=A0A9X2CUZ8_9BACI|nr:hypothetical protein [Halalkalibacter alkaliphilus]MCL7748752.1 hypothetical protein [Halalkalibacter alkaliphilus]